MDSNPHIAERAEGAKAFDDWTVEKEVIRDDNQVGYRKPPIHTRFKKGQSGNPRGRPAGVKNLRTLLEKALNKRVTIQEDDGERTISKFNAMVEQLVDRAVRGDQRATQLIFRYLQSLDSSEPEEPQVVFVLPDNGR